MVGGFFSMKLEPLSKSHYAHNSIDEIVSSKIKDAGGSPAARGVMDENIFLIQDSQGMCNTSKNYMKDNIMSYIKVSPTLNPIFTARGLGIAELLHLTSQDWTALYTCQKMLVVRDSHYELVNTQDDDSYVDIETMFFGGEAIKYIAEHTDVRKNICLYIENVLIGIPEVKPYRKLISVNTHMGVRLFDGIYLANPIPGVSIEQLQKELIGNPKTSKLANMLQCNSGDDLVKKILIERVRVTPIGTRPEFRGNNSCLSVLYVHIVAAQKAIETSNRASMVKEYAQAYYNLFIQIRNLLTSKNEENRSNCVSIMEDMKKKKGLIRGHMEGKRQDFSARSSIVIDPDCSINRCRVPEGMLKTLMSFHTDKSTNYLSYSEAVSAINVALNRAPTLHRLGIQSFEAEAWDKNSLGVNPLVCTAYNADFDGDQMAVHVPLTYGAIQEINELMAAIRNRFSPASGAPVHVPKHEMLYGLYMMSKKNESGVDSGLTLTDDNVVEALVKQQAHLYDFVTYNRKKMTLGRALVKYVLPPELMEEITTIDKASITRLIEHIASYPLSKLQYYTVYIDRLVRVGFRVATLYPPNITPFIQTTQEIDIQEPVREFDRKISKNRELYAKGFESINSYHNKYSELFYEMDKNVENNIYKFLPEDNGHRLIVESGARGSVNILKQIMYYKGQIESSVGSTFDVIIRSNYIRQLTPTEQVMCALGSRRGLIDKSIKPGETGYAMRNMKHCLQDFIITEEDCGTQQGFTISYETLRKFAGNSLSKADFQNMLKDIIVGRYTAGDNKFITSKVADTLIKSGIEEITIRSPLTCKNPCCSKCYGVDLSYRRKALNGTPIGTTSAQSVGEPGTQMTMKSFQKGGVALKDDKAVTSDFELISDILYCVKATPTKTQDYDPVAWASGPISSNVEGYFRNVYIGDDKSTTVKLPIHVKLKEYVSAGDGLCASMGTLNIPDIAEYSNITKALEYIVYKLYLIYKSQSNVNIKHMELLAASMAAYVVLDSDNYSDFYPGMVLNKVDYARKNPGSAVVGYWAPMSMQRVPVLRDNFLGGMGFREVGYCMATAILRNKEDDLTQATSRILVGRAPLQGTAYNPNYIAQRREEEENPCLV